MSTEVEPPARCPNCDRVMAMATKMVIAATEVSAEEIQRLRLELAAANAKVVIAATEVSVEEIRRLRLELAAAKALLMSTSTPSFGLGLSVEQEQALKARADEMKAEMAIDCLIVGEVYRHPQDGRLLRVTDGSYLGGYERVSNYWHWRYLDEESLVAGDSGQGYGWAAKPVEGLVPCDHCGVRPNQESDADEQCSMCGKGDDR